MALHHATRGFRAGADAYERGRPAYPPEAVGALLAAMGPATLAVELGAGTGKLTRLLASGRVAVVAVEPVAAMRARLVAIPGVAVIAGAAEAIPLATGRAGAVVAASAFHWFDGPRALAEIHRVLRPGGTLALLFNRRDEAVPWIRRLSEVVNRHEGDTPRYRSGRWREAFTAAPDLFGPLEESHFRHVHVLSPEGVVDRVASTSFIAAMPAAERDGVLDEVRALLASEPETVATREIPLAYLTDLFWARRR